MPAITITAMIAMSSASPPLMLPDPLPEVVTISVGEEVVVAVAAAPSDGMPGESGVAALEVGVLTTVSGVVAAAALGLAGVVAELAGVLAEPVGVVVPALPLVE